MEIKSSFLSGVTWERVSGRESISFSRVVSTLSKSPRREGVITFLVFICPLCFWFTQRYGFPGVLPNITNLDRPPPCTGVSLGWVYPGSSVRAVPHSIPILLRWEPDIAPPGVFFSLRNYFFREWDWVCGLGLYPLRDLRGYPPGGSPLLPSSTSTAPDRVEVSVRPGVKGGAGIRGHIWRSRTGRR